VRLFFAAEVSAPWPLKLPQGRWIEPQFRHMTLVFLGDQDPKKVGTLTPSWKLPPVGILEEWIFLPEQDPRVVAAKPHFLRGEDELKKLAKEPFLPHVTLAREPLDEAAWKNFPCHIPFFVSGVSLLHSLGHSNYETVWETKSLAPFEEIEHTADIAYIIRGENFQQLALHATLALSFTFPAFTSYLRKISSVSSIQEIVLMLNRWISEIDIQEGIGLKAVSQHATVRGEEILEWTMIVDV
jgi:RNA 2',3'-cyclic 3'-phosphodiesterase